VRNNAVAFSYTATSRKEDRGEWLLQYTVGRGSPEKSWWKKGWWPWLNETLSAQDIKKNCGNTQIVTSRHEQSWAW